MQIDSLLPLPAQVLRGEGELPLTRDTSLTADPECRDTALWLRGELGTACGLPLPEGGPDAALRLRVDPGADTGAEGYRLRVDREGATIVGADPAGVWFGAQTLRQLLPAAAYRRAPVADGWCLPAVEIADRPRFPWRGCMLDVARHFLPKREVMRLVDLISAHKLNVLHLHLTDDQGWRLEVERYPRLTEVGGWRRESQVGAGRPPVFDGRPHGGYYTRDDIREIVAYAAARRVAIVPEVDLPGHSRAAIAAYPELGLGGAAEVARTWGVLDGVLNVSDATLEFYRNVFDEVLELFPGRYICVGGDECPKEGWRSDPGAQERIRREGLAGEEELQSWFIRRFDAYFAERGRRLLGWDEILEGGLAPGATVASWRGTAGGVAAARAGHDVVMCPTDTFYLDYRQSGSAEEPVPVGRVVDLERVYTAEPVPPELTEQEARHVLGAQVNVWTEHMDTPRAVDYMVFPRLCAFAEAVWSAGGRDYARFLPRLRGHLRRLDALGVEYRPLEGPLPWQRRPGVTGWP